MGRLAGMWVQIRGLLMCLSACSCACSHYCCLQRWTVLRGCMLIGSPHRHGRLSYLLSLQCLQLPARLPTCLCTCLQYYDIPSISLRAAVWTLMQANISHFKVTRASIAVCAVCYSVLA